MVSLISVQLSILINSLAPQREDSDQKDQRKGYRVNSSKEKSKLHKQKMDEEEQTLQLGRQRS